MSVPGTDIKSKSALIWQSTMTPSPAKDTSITPGIRLEDQSTSIGSTAHGIVPWQKKRMVPAGHHSFLLF